MSSPLNVETVQRIIRLERPDSLLPTLGGQTGSTWPWSWPRAATLR